MYNGNGLPARTAGGGISDGKLEVNRVALYVLLCSSVCYSPDSPLPPNNIRATPISQCMTSITWTTPPTSITTATADTYIFEIQLLENGLPEQWIELGRSPSPLLQVLIPSRGLNTTYNLRGHGYNGSVGNGAYSVAYGPYYISYALPTITGHTARLNNDTVRVTWSVENITCFMFDEVSINCGEDIEEDIEDEEMSLLVTGLDPDTEYNCYLSGVVTEASQVARKREVVVVTVTIPRAGMCIRNAPLEHYNYYGAGAYVATILPYS